MLISKKFMILYLIISKSTHGKQKIIIYIMMHKLSFVTYLNIPLLMKHLTKQDQNVYVPSQEMVISLPLLIFYNVILYLRFQILGLPKIY